MCGQSGPWLMNEWDLARWSHMVIIVLYVWAAYPELDEEFVGERGSLQGGGIFTSLRVLCLLTGFSIQDMDAGEDHEMQVTYLPYFGADPVAVDSAIMVSSYALTMWHPDKWAFLNEFCFQECTHLRNFFHCQFSRIVRSVELRILSLNTGALSPQGKRASREYLNRLLSCMSLMMSPMKGTMLHCHQVALLGMCRTMMSVWSSNQARDTWTMRRTLFVPETLGLMEHPIIWQLPAKRSFSDWFSTPWSEGQTWSCYVSCANVAKSWYHIVVSHPLYAIMDECRKNNNMHRIF